MSTTIGVTRWGIPSGPRLVAMRPVNACRIGSMAGRWLSGPRLAEAGDRDVNDAGVDGHDVVVADAEASGHGRPKSLEEDVGPSDEPADDLATFVGLKI